ncbi:MAG: hypothetical protein WC390_06715 [Sulfurimonas sp.]|jgi:hypothetical protein
MAKEKVKKEEGEEVTLTPSQQLQSFLKETKEDHYNFEQDHNYKVPCSSLLLTSTLAGGLTPGAHRFLGLASGGKTSCALDFMYHFLRTPSPLGCERRASLIMSEGRLSKEVQERSGINFAFKAEDWLPNTCFVLQTNIYEVAFSFKRKFISIPGLEMFFLTDCADSLIKRDDCRKPEEESITVGSGSLITSVFLKKVGLAMAKRGHIDIYISQIRDQIKINQYEVTTPKQGKASGPRALEHQAGVVLEFLPRFGGDLIQEDGKKSKIEGHFCKCRIIKSDNEKNMVEVRYPVRYNQRGAKSVWLSYELVDCLILWEILKKKGAWLVFNEEFRAEIIKNLNRDEIPEQINGVEKAREWVEDNEDVQRFLFEKFKDLHM